MRDTFDYCAERRSRLAGFIDQLFPTSGCRFIGTEKRVFVDLGLFEIGAINGITADFNDIGQDFDLGDYRTRDRACRNTRRRFACRTPPATAIVAKAIFGIIAVIGMSGAIGLGNFGIILFRWSTFSIIRLIGVPVVRPSKMPERMRT